MGFDQGIMPSTIQNRNMLSFQSGSGFSNPQGMAGPVNLGNSGLFFTGNPSMMNNSIASIGSQDGASSSNKQLEPVSGIKQDSGLSPEWTFEEQNMLRQGLIKYAGEHGMMKYIKIAAMLHRKTVRDVALRCRWLAENDKRRKLEDYHSGKRMYRGKEKVVDSCLSSNRYMVNPGTSASYPPLVHQGNQNDLFSPEVPALDSATQQLVDDNNQMLHQIATNLATYKVQQNIDLFCHTRNNITTILNNMSNMPGIMSQMPPLPASVNEELLSAMLSCPTQGLMLSSSGINLEQQTQYDQL